MIDSDDDFVGPVNVGNPGEFTMLKFAELVLELADSRSSIVDGPVPQDDPKQRRPDITLAEAKLGWQPKVALRDGQKETIAYFRQLVAA